MAPFFGEVLLAPQWRSDGMAVSWSWRPAAGTERPNRAELAEFRSRLRQARDRFTASLVGPDAQRSDGVPAALAAPLTETVSKLVDQLAGLKDAALGGYICRTEGGWRGHSWGAPQPATPLAPGAHGHEVRGTLLVGDTGAAGIDVVMENRKGVIVSRVRSDAAGEFIFPNVNAGNYRVRALSETSDFPVSGLEVVVGNEAVSGLKLRSTVLAVGQEKNAATRGSAVAGPVGAESSRRSVVEVEETPAPNAHSAPQRGRRRIAFGLAAAVVILAALWWWRESAAPATAANDIAQSATAAQRRGTGVDIRENSHGNFQPDINHTHATADSGGVSAAASAGGKNAAAPSGGAGTNHIASGASTGTAASSSSTKAGAGASSGAAATAVNSTAPTDSTENGKIDHISPLPPPRATRATKVAAGESPLDGQADAVAASIPNAEAPENITPLAAAAPAPVAGVDAGPRAASDKNHIADKGGAGAVAADVGVAPSDDAVAPPDDVPISADLKHANAKPVIAKSPSPSSPPAEPVAESSGPEDSSRAAAAGGKPADATTDSPDASQSTANGRATTLAKKKTPQGGASSENDITSAEPGATGAEGSAEAAARASAASGAHAKVGAVTASAEAGKSPASAADAKSAAPDNITSADASWAGNGDAGSNSRKRKSAGGAPAAASSTAEADSSSAADGAAAPRGGAGGASRARAPKSMARAEVYSAVSTPAADDAPPAESSRWAHVVEISRPAWETRLWRDVILPTVVVSAESGSSASLAELEEKTWKAKRAEIPAAFVVGPREGIRLDVANVEVVTNPITWSVVSRGAPPAEIAGGSELTLPRTQPGDSVEHTYTCRDAHGVLLGSVRGTGSRYIVSLAQGVSAVYWIDAPRVYTAGSHPGPSSGTRFHWKSGVEPDAAGPGGSASGDAAGARHEFALTPAADARSETPVAWQDFVSGWEIAAPLRLAGATGSATAGGRSGDAGR